MIDEKIFAYAVTIAAAFVANGDIRCHGTTKKDSEAVMQIEGIVSSLYLALQNAREDIEGAPVP